jgi:uncharacterized protein YdeI (YjbR/CyaY-like superfamily)
VVLANEVHGGQTHGSFSEPHLAAAAPVMSIAPQYFKTPSAFRRWLEAHADTAAELIVGFHKVGSGRPSMTWPESVDEALCFGWIDGVRKRIDDASYQIRFTSRKTTSIWSAVNIAKFHDLQACGRMTAAGAKAFGHRQDVKSVVYAYEQDAMAELTSAELEVFQREKTAWAYFEACPPSYKKVLLHWITTAKRSDTRASRLATLVAACLEEKRLR